MGAYASPTTGVNATYYPNFRYNGKVGPNGQPGLLVPGPDQLGMDEDYDACDLENWFLAIQSADGQVMIPSFHRPAIIRYDPNGVDGAIVNDWTRLNQLESQRRPALGRLGCADPPALPGRRPRRGDLPRPGARADHRPDHLRRRQRRRRRHRLGLARPGLSRPPDSSGRLYKPLFAFMVIGLNGRIPLNTAGNLAAQVQGIYIPPTDGA